MQHHHPHPFSRNLLNTATQRNLRRHDLDWLRVIAFGILIYFHAGVAFLPTGIPQILNNEPSLIAGVLVSFFTQFRLALLFLVSGCGVYFALRKRDRSTFWRERSKRLLIPLIFGILFLVPPMVYLEKLYLGEFAGSFLEFYRALLSDGVYPAGNLSWHHFWFIAYLYLFCIAGWPALSFLKSKSGQAKVEYWIERYSLQKYGIYLYILPLLMIEIILRPLFPGFRDLISDWANFFHWYLIFLAGYVLANNQTLLARVAELRFHSLGLGVFTSCILFTYFWSQAKGIHPFGDGEIDVLKFLLYCLIRISSVWAWILVCLGFATHYLNKPSTTLSYLNRAVYPFFCIHLTVLVAVEYLVIPTNWSIFHKYVVITIATSFWHEGQT